ncbi:hypothetical protein M408DRAFT_23890 [Serendipita vermifera MAFF 305830]|uniref:Uncharacterized protein n=1 Tax=Serendipita vermifera MAFF 305830 TaxID=933852 RepID=A0A0C3B7U4_SERVB|nr:hypothetical protein M408DRAFT_23890 [Serendipita vermifera MAFF 305830]
MQSCLLNLIHQGMFTPANRGNTPVSINTPTSYRKLDANLRFLKIMKSTLLILGTYFLIAQATEVCHPVTYTLEAPPSCPYILCLAEPTLTYTTKTSVTVTRTLPCETYYTIGPVPVTVVKRTDSDAALCPPIFTTKKPTCGCPTATATKTTVVTSTATSTTYKPCPTKTRITIIEPTLTLSTITATPKSTLSSTTTKGPIITCPIHCSSPSGTVTVYNEEPAAVAPGVECVQYCPLETM